MKKTKCNICAKEIIYADKCKPPKNCVECDSTRYKMTVDEMVKRALME